MASIKPSPRISTYSPRLAPLLRKGRILFDHEEIAAQLIAKAAQRFRQGPPAASLHERIRLKADCFHWLGKVEDLRDKPNTAQYLLQVFFEDCLSAFFRTRGLWLTAPVDSLRFMASRDPALGDLAGQFLSAATLHERLLCGRRFADALFRDIPLPPVWINGTVVYVQLQASVGVPVLGSGSIDTESYGDAPRVYSSQHQALHSRIIREGQLWNLDLSDSARWE